MAERTLTLTPNAALDIWTTTKTVTSGPKLRCSAPRFDAGGGGINVSRVIHRLGGQTVALYAAGGSSGARLTHALAAEQVPALRVDTEEETRQSFNVCEEADGGVFRFVLPGPQVHAMEGEALLACLDGEAQAGDLVVGSGSLPPGLARDYWAGAAQRVHAAGGRFILDSAHGVAEALKVGVWLLRLNHDEAAAMAGGPLRWPDQAARWAADTVAANGTAAVIVTQGAEGAILATPDTQLRVRPPQGIRVLSAIGAGDSFIGGLCLGLPRGDDLPTALRLAVATATATLLTPGTELCRKADVDRLLQDTGQVVTV